MCAPGVIEVGSILVGLSAASSALDYIGEKLYPTPPLPNLPDAPKPPPKAVDPKAQGARARERDKLRASRGIASTILTGGGGLTTAPITSNKTLLGQ